MIKINLDLYSLEVDFKEISKIILHNKNEVLLFFNDEKGNKLNKNLIFYIIFFLEKYSPQTYYYFYNVPFCLFKKFSEKFIDNHLVFNKLCNYYIGYESFGKCNKCKYGLFCNNINSNFSDEDKQILEGYYEEEIENDEFLKKFGEIYDFLIELGYKKDDFAFYMTQKFTYDFAFGKIKSISKNHMNFFILYILLPNNKLTLELFEEINRGILILKNENSKKLNDFLNCLGFNISFIVSDREDIVDLKYKNYDFLIDKYFSVSKYLGEKPFFDFEEEDIFANKKIKEFRGKVHNPQNLVLITSFYPIENSQTSINKSGEIYIGRDIIGGNNINSYMGLLLTTDNLGDKDRFVSSINSIKIPVIYNIKPNILKILEKGDKIEIDFNSGIIKKC